MTEKDLYRIEGNISDAEPYPHWELTLKYLASEMNRICGVPKRFLYSVEPFENKSIVNVEVEC